MRVSDNPEQIGSILNRVLRKSGFQTKLREKRVVLNWEKVVGTKISSQAKAYKAEDSKLFVMVKSAVWRNELFFQKKQIIDKLNQSVGGKVIKDIIFVNQ